MLDPEAFAGSWTVPLKFELDADTEDLEYVCNENERDRSHLTGKASDVKAVHVAPAILAKYVGTYELKIPDNGRILNLTISLDGDSLTAGGLGMSAPLKAISETDFTASFGGIKFVTDLTGAVTHLLLQAVEGDIKAVRTGGAAPDAKK
jgi:hypothetical protein